MRNKKCGSDEYLEHKRAGPKGNFFFINFTVKSTFYSRIQRISSHNADYLATQGNLSSAIFIV